MKKIYSHCLSTTLPTFSWLYVFARYSRKQENSFEPARWRYHEEAPPLKAFDRSADFLKNASEFNSPTTARNYGTLRERQAESRQKRVKEYILLAIRYTRGFFSRSPLVVVRVFRERTGANLRRRVRLEKSFRITASTCTKHCDRFQFKRVPQTWIFIFSLESRFSPDKCALLLRFLIYHELYLTRNVIDLTVVIHGG